MSRGLTPRRFTPMRGTVFQGAALALTSGMPTDPIELDVGPDGIAALRNAIDRQLGRYKGTMAQYHAANAPQEHRKDVKQRANALAALARDAADPELDGQGRPVVRHDPADRELLRDELARIYAEFGPESRPEASRHTDDLDVEEIAALLAGWGHRA